MKNSVDINIDRSLIQTEEQMLARWGEYDKPLVSICCTTYNHEKYIADAIEGFLIQKTNFPFEILIRDDCSTDRTAEIIKKYYADYPHVIKPVFEKENQYRKGIKPMPVLYPKAQGKYIAFCEGDDYWHHPNKLQMQVDVLESFPECGLVCTDFDLFKTSSGRRKKSIRKKSGAKLQSININDIVASSAKILTLTVVARKDLILTIRKEDTFLHENSYFLMGDTQLWAEISLLSKIYYIDKSSSTHNLLVESTTQSNNIVKRMCFQKSNCEMLIYLCNKHSLPSFIRKKIELRLCNILLKLAFFENRIDLLKEAAKYGNKGSFNNIFWYFGTKYALLRPLAFVMLWLKLNLVILTIRRIYFFVFNKLAGQCRYKHIKL